MPQDNDYKKVDKKVIHPDLASEIEGKAESIHTHTESEITDIGTHTHSQYATSSTVNAQLSGKADSSTLTAHTGDTVAHLTGAEHTKLTGLQNYTLPIATPTVLGGVKQGSNVTIDGSGNISVASPYVHPATHSADILTDGTTNKVYTATEKTKLAGIQDSANNYTHPANHSADIIVDGTTNKTYTATEKTKLAGIENNANNYTHPANHPASIITEDATHRFTTDTEKSTWNSKAAGTHTHTKSQITDYTDYVHPASHSPSIITQDASNRFVTDTEKSTWNGKQNALSGDVTTHYHTADRYTHPANHSPSIITQDASNRFVTDTEKTNWNGAVTNSHTHSNKALLDTYTQTEVNLADAVAKKHSNANDHTPSTVGTKQVDETNIGDGKVLKYNSTSGKIEYQTDTGGTSGATINDVSTTSTTETWSANKINTQLGTKQNTLSGDVATHYHTSDRYTHPANHSADIIVDGTTNKVYTATEKTKLAGIQDSANNYTHPASHPPSIITQDANNRFVTDAEKSTWNSKEPAITKNTAFNLNLGTTAGTVAEGNHTHGASGDMLKSTYDTTNNGIVDNAEKVNGVTYTVGTVAPSSPTVNDIWIDTN